MHFCCDKCFLSVCLCAAFWNLGDQELFVWIRNGILASVTQEVIGSNLTALLYGSYSESFKMNTGTSNYLKFFKD
jgi:hypothetical protein